MPNLTPEQLVITLSAIPHYAGCRENIYHYLIDKLESKEMLAFIETKEVNVSLDEGHERKFASLFDALIDRYYYYHGCSHSYPLISLMLFFNKLKKAIDALEDNSDAKQEATKFFNERLSFPFYSYDDHHHSNNFCKINLFRYVAELSTQSKDSELFKQFIHLVGIPALDNAVRNPVNHTWNGFIATFDGHYSRNYVARTIIDSISDNAFNEVIINPMILNYCIHSRDTLLVIIVRANSDIFNTLIQQPKVISSAMQHLNPEELHELVFGKISNILLNQVIANIVYKDNHERYTVWNELLTDVQGSVVFDKMMRKLSPFSLKDGMLPILRSQFELNIVGRYRDADYESLKTHKENCEIIISFITAPKDAIKRCKNGFLSFLAFHLDSDNQMLTDVMQWHGVVVQAKSACDVADTATIEKLNYYIWKLQRRSEFKGKEVKLSDRETLWVPLKEVEAAKKSKQDEIESLNPNLEFKK